MRTQNYLGHWIVTIGAAMIGGVASLFFTWPFHLMGVIGGGIAGYLWCCWMDRLFRKHERMNEAVWVGGIFSGPIVGLIATILLYVALGIPSVQLGSTIGNQTDLPSVLIITVGLILALMAGLAYGGIASLIFFLFHRHPETSVDKDADEADA